ncbi:MAG: hypothetical protein LBT84_02050 [Spirochaetia bacterium]|jgi:hypothetical protein|nr:hypothetical protein [Spirochaetia bacterium]
MKEISLFDGLWRNSGLFLTAILFENTKFTFSQTAAGSDYKVNICHGDFSYTKRQLTLHVKKLIILDVVVFEEDYPFKVVCSYSIKENMLYIKGVKIDSIFYVGSQDSFEMTLAL